MGCCFSKDEDKRSQGEPSENSRLLANPVGNSSQHSFHDSYGGTQGGTSQQKKGDDQSALNRILHQTAANVIDVSALELHLEQHEYLNRSRQYAQRVSLQAVLPNSNPCLLQDVAPQEVLSRPPLAPAHLQMMDELTDKLQQVLSDIQVEHKEDLVVQLCAPT